MEHPRWNDELKRYTMKVYTPEQAIMIREAMKMVSADDEKDLNASAPSDEDIAEIFDFPEAKSATISVVAEFDFDGDVTKAIGGDTYPWKDELNKKSFAFNKIPRAWPPTNSSDLTGTVWDRSLGRLSKPPTKN